MLNIRGSYYARADADQLELSTVRKFTTLALARSLQTCDVDVDASSSGSIYVIQRDTTVNAIELGGIN